MGRSSFDVAVIGGGHNALTAACYLANAQLAVIVLEKNDVLGGAAVTDEFHPGFRNSAAAYTVSLLNPKIIRDLDLSGHGLRIIERPVANFWPVDAEHYLLFPYGLQKRQAEIAKFSSADASALPQYDADLERAANVLRRVIMLTPPNAGGGIAELIRAGLVGRMFAWLGAADKRLIIDLFTRSADDFLRGYFEHEVVRAAFAFDGIVGSYASPKSAGTAYVLLHHCFGEVNGKPGVWGHAIGGMGSITKAMAAAATARGVTLRTNAKVRTIVAHEGRAVGVELDTGEVINAKAIAAGIPPKLLFRDLICDNICEPSLQKRFLSIDSGSGTFRMNVALSELPDFTCRPGTTQQDHHGSGIIIGPSIDYLDRAYLDARTNGWSTNPIIEMLVPSTLDPTLAPPGQHVASLFVQQVAPHLPDGRSWANPSEKERFADIIIDTMTDYAPNFARSVIARQILSPLDLEQRFGLIDGDIFHGQLGLGQLFSLRPVAGYANYRMPIEGLYLCGSGAHPGGGVSGVPGYNCAREIIADLTSWRRKAWPNACHGR